MIRSILVAVIVGAFLAFAACSPDPVELSWHEEDGYRWAELPAGSGAQSGFEEVSSSRSGVSFVNTVDEESILQNRHFMNGSGVAVGDVDGDGWTDLYFARLDGPNVLYRNLGGWRFEDVTADAGVGAPNRYSTGAVFADVDGDGDLDLLVTAMGGPNSVFVNDGNGRFAEAETDTGLESSSGSTTMALSDVDGDGDLDLYVANYKKRSVSDIYPPWEHSFDRTIIGNGDDYRIAPGFEEHYEIIEHAGGFLRVERAEPNAFYLNDGEGRFSPVPLTAGAFLDEDGVALEEAPEDWTLTARFHDVNGDGAPDLYICNDFHSPDYFFLGDGEGGFEAAPRLALRKTSFSTMSADFSDIDRDGHLDFFLTDMLSRDHARRMTQVGLTIPMTTEIGEIENRPQAVQNTLFLNRGDDTYAEIAQVAGVAASDWTWSGLFLDVDLDGYEDLLLATGHAFDVLDIDSQQREHQREGATRDHDAHRRLLLDFPQLHLENVAFRNRGDHTFEIMPSGWGLGEEEDVSNALAFGDFDNDGYVDVVVNRLNDTAGLFRNAASAPRVAVRLRGLAPNTQAIGSKIRLTGGGLPMQEKEVISGGQYLSGSDPIYTFAAGSADSVLSIEVAWRSGGVTRIEDVRANRILEIDEPDEAREDGLSGVSAESGSSDPNDGAPFESVDYAAGADSNLTASLFMDESERLGHRHVEADYVDFERQPLLPRALSRQGPAVVWADLDGDGRDDLVVGSGRGGSIGVFRNEGNGRFSDGGDFGEAPDDLAGLAALEKANGGALVFAAMTNLERGSADSSSIFVFDFGADGRAVLDDRLPFGREGIGPLVLADVDGDGDLDLFAGGRSTPGRYPTAASSRIYLNENGTFRYDSTLSTPLDDAGVVSGAAFADFDNDGDADLLLATEWGPVRFFQNEGGRRMVERTSEIGLDRFTGQWQSVSVGDFNEDGRPDFIATNWGWNGVHGRIHQAETPLRLYYDDFDSNGSLDVIEAYHEPSLDGYVPQAGLASLSQAMPYVQQRIPTFDRFAASTLQEIIGPRIDRAPYLEAGTLSTMVFLNASDGVVQFEGTPLPFEAQIAPASSAAVADFDGDGHEDVFLGQNFFPLPMDVPRQDAGRGLLLIGDGSGGFTPVPGHESGLTIYGEQRGTAAADYDSDGRTDLVVTQNGAETKLYRNTGGSPEDSVSYTGSAEQ